MVKAFFIFLSEDRPAGGNATERTWLPIIPKLLSFSGASEVVKYGAGFVRGEAPTQQKQHSQVAAVSCDTESALAQYSKTGRDARGKLLCSLWVLVLGGMLGLWVGCGVGNLLRSAEGLSLYHAG